MLALDFAMQATLVVATSVLGAMVFLAAPRRAPNLALAAFFFLIAGNQAVESLRRIIDPASPTLWAAGVFAALDPIALYYFVAIYPKPNRLRSALPFGIVLGAGWSLALLAGWQGAQPLTSSQIWLLTSVFTAIVYTVLFAHIVNASKATPSDPAIRLLLPAFAVAAMPTWARTVEAGPSLLPSGLVTVERGLILAAGLAVLLSLAAIIALAARSPVSIRRPFLAGATLGALIAAIPLIRAASRADLLPFADPVALTWTAVAARWLVFGLLVSIAVLRYDFLGMSLKTRRHTARALVIGVVLAVAALALASARQAWEGAWIPLTIAEVAVLAVVLVASQGFRGLVDRLAEKVYGVPMPGDTAASLERYRSAVEAVLREGRGLDELVRLRDELGLDPRSAALIETAILGPRTGFSAGERIAGRYTIERVLGRGSQSIAYLATEGGRHLVVKEIHAAGSSQALHEVRALTTARHPNVLAVLDVIEKDARVMIVTEYASEGSLDELLATRGRLSVSESRPIIAGILAGLSHVHAKGIVHGDLKPANILLANGLTPKIGDFGLARFIHEATSSPGAAAIAGTPAYLAPELRRGERATPASDLYAVGLIAKRAIKDIPPDLGEVLDRATRSEMAERFPDAETMRAAFLRAIQEPHDPRSFVRPGPAES